MEENYSLDKIMTKILYQEDERKETRENEDREIQKKEVQNRRNLWEKEEVRYDTREHDWIAEQEMEACHHGRDGESVDTGKAFP